MNEPPCKRLKQPTIAECLNSQKSTTMLANDKVIVPVVDLTHENTEKKNTPMSKNESSVKDDEGMAATGATGGDRKLEAPGSSDQDDPNQLSGLNDSSPDSRENEHYADDHQEQLAAASEDRQDYGGKRAYVGIEKQRLHTTPKCSLPLPPLSNTKLHKVLVKIGSVQEGKIPKPYPSTFTDAWDSDHVRMPCSPQSSYPHKNRIENRWKMIQKALRRSIANVWDLEETILEYNSRQRGFWDFDNLYKLFDEETDLQSRFFGKILPKMVALALNIHDTCTAPIPLLRKGTPHMITLSQKQVACLLANAFFCTFPSRNSKKRTSSFYSFPDINFNGLFKSPSIPGKSKRKMEKLKCIIHYFERVTEKMPTGLVSFKRKLVRKFPSWAESTTQLCELHVANTGNIEEDGVGMLQVDFANKFIGGGVLGHGCVQEEIRFLMCPEMIVSRLFTESLDDNECLVMIGCETYSAYVGYSDSFRWLRNYEDVTPRDSWKRRHTEVVAIDALISRNKHDQFNPHLVQRELEKAFCGFDYHPDRITVQSTDDVTQSYSAIATGNWGCGAFGGDARLKGLIQLMAAAEAHRDVCYFTFKDFWLSDDLNNIHTFIRDNKICNGDLFKLIQAYHAKVIKLGKTMELYDFIRKNHDKSNNSSPSSPDFAEDSMEYDQNSPDYTANTP